MDLIADVICINDSDIQCQVDNVWGEFTTTIF